MDITINHGTDYGYSAPVSYALQKVRLRPLASQVQRVAEWQIEIAGGRIETSYRDHHGNHVDLVSLDPGGQGLRLRAHGTVETLDGSGVFGRHDGVAPLWYYRQQTPLTRPGAAIRALPAVAPEPAGQLDSLHALSAAILQALPYATGTTGADTGAEAALQGTSGVCQDHAQIFVSAARLSGLPARYVSGYLLVNDQTEQEATHAWAEVHVEGLGWVGFDVSNGVSPDEKYARIATGRDARDAAPVAGLRMGSAEESLVVSLQVQQ
ncbi:transglutaminase family protein [Marinovum sp.]|uniref:transglutaminase family protein n=1 Tax=Marinovum sp. TaxID=2024839 RepID=UPI002B26AE2B|nr:transglutaminase family protein [Marinovum sp.]